MAREWISMKPAGFVEKPGKSVRKLSLHWSYRLLFIPLVSLIFTGPFLWGQVQIQIGPGGGLPGQGMNSGEGGLDGGVDLPRDPELNKRLEAAADYLKEKDWAKGVTILQRLLETGEDVFVRVTPELAKAIGEAVPGVSIQGKDISIRALAGRIVSRLPKDGMDIYQAAYGQTAQDQLKEAREKGDLEKLSNVFRAFLNTEAGRQAAVFLATYHLDRGDPLAAALCFERLIQSDPKNEVSLPETAWLKGAVAMHLSGDKPGEELIWKRMEERGLKEVQIAGRKRPLNELKNQVAATRNGDLKSIADWELVGGDTSRNAIAQGGVPFLEPNWKPESTVLERIFVPLPERATVTLPVPGAINTREKLAEIEKSVVQDKNQAQIPPQQPLAIDIGSSENRISLAVYRSHGGLVARNLKTGAIHWANPIDWSMDRMAHGGLLSKPKHRDALDHWLMTYAAGGWVTGGGNSGQAGVLENSTVGTISSDGQRVFTISDFEISPPVSPQYGFPMGGPMDGPMGAFARFGSDVVEAVQQNRLEAYHLVTGKLLWRVGGRETTPGFDFTESLFLGAPLAIGDRLFLLNEKQQELRLVTLDGATGRVLGLQRLCTVRDRVQQDPLRRTTAAHLAYADGILVCPTNAGVVMGVELLTRSFVWAYAYRDPSESNNMNAGFPGGRIPGAMIQPGVIRPGRMVPNPGINPNGNVNGLWKSSPPRIVEGRLVFTSPDSQALVCLGLKDGALQWKSKREDDDLYVAGVRDGKVIVVGKKNVRALDLRDGGKKLWSVEAGLPSGYASLADHLLYVPIRDTGPSSQPEVCVIDTNQGRILSRTRSRKLTPVGNLVFHEGEMVSVSGDQVSVYPLLAAKLAQIDARIKANPNDPVGLMERGQMRLDKGDWAGAVEDLSKSVKGAPPREILAKARENLHEAFVEYFGSDFTKAEPYLAEFESTCSMEIPPGASGQIIEEVRKEEKKRKSSYLKLLARGRESQGRILEAFDTYLQIAALGAETELDPVLEEKGLKATPDIWARGRIAAMVAKADPAARKELDGKVAARWAEMRNKNVSTSEMRKFALVFGALLDSGRAAQLELALRISREGGAKGFLQGEQDLISLRESARTPQDAGLVVLEMARLYLDKGLSEDAADCFRLLGTAFENTNIQGKTGAQLAASGWADKRLVPFLERNPRWFTKGSVRALPVETNVANNPRYTQSFVLTPGSDCLPFFNRLKVTLQFNTGRSNFNQLRMVEGATGQEVFNEILSRENLLGQPQAAQVMLGSGQGAQPLPFQARGHLMLVEAINSVHLVDPVEKHDSNRHELWNLNLHNPRELAGQTGSQISSIQVNDKGEGGYLVQFQDGWKMRLGQSAVLGGGVVVLVTRDGLMAVDPITGSKLWLREDVRSDSRIHQVGSHLLVVEMDPEGKAKSTRLLRLADGVENRIADFSQQYQKKRQIIGENLVLQEPAGESSSFLISMNMETGKEIWRTPLPSASLLAEEEGDGTLSWIEPDGKFRRIDGRTGKDLMQAKVDPAHMVGAAAKVLLDNEKLYLMLHRPAAAGATVQTNFNPGAGIQQIHANGELYAFDRGTGKTTWRVNAKNQMLVTENFGNLPVVLFTSRYTKPGNGNARQYVAGFLSIDKKSGKRLMDEEKAGSQQFQNFKIDTRKGRIELEAPGTRIVHQVTGPGGK